MASTPDSTGFFPQRALTLLPLLLVAVGLLIMAGAALRLTQLPPLPSLRAIEPVQQAQTALGYEGYLGALQRYMAAPSMNGVTELRRFQTNAEQAIMTLQSLNEPALDAPAWAAVLTLFQSATGRIEDSLSSGQALQPDRYTPLYTAYQRLATLSSTVQLAGTNATQAALANRAAQQRQLLWWLWGGILLGLTGALWWLYRQRQAADMVVESADGQMRPGKFNVRFGSAAQATFQGLVAELTRTVEGLRSADMPATLQNVEELCRALARTVALTHEDLTGTASAMRATGDRWQQSEDRLDTLVAALETRAATVAEIAKLTGAQVQGSLKDIVSAQTQMRYAAGQVADTFTQSGGRAEELSERLLAATNLLRASGKVLQETVDSVRTRMLDATSALTQTDARLTTVIEHNNVRLGELASQAEAVLARGAEGQEALATLTAASDRIHATAQKLELSESDLGQAVATMLAQSDTFAPLTEQLRELHAQLAQGNAATTQTAIMPDATVSRLEAAADRLADLTDEMRSGNAIQLAPLNNALDQLARLSQLTDTLGAMLGQLEKVATAQPVTTIASTAAPTIIDNVELSDMAALRINASLQLVQGQVSELLGRLAGEQQQLIEQVGIVQRTCEQLRGQRFDRAHLDEALNMLGLQIERSHSGFTGELTGFLNRFEQALAVPMHGDDTNTSPEVTPLARAILAKLRGDTNGDTANAESVEAATAEISLRDALTRMTQIKKLTGALNRQSEGLSAMAAAAPTAEATALANQARALITEVMDAISELSATAATITETADRLNQAS